MKTQIDARDEVVVKFYLECSTCQTPYILRRAVLIMQPGSPTKWVWQRDCKCKKTSVRVCEEKTSG